MNQSPQAGRIKHSCVQHLRVPGRLPQSQHSQGSQQTQHSPKTPKTQRGLVLAVGLIVLAVMMMVGLAAVRQVAQSTRLATHGADRSLAFQAADSALREIEQRLEQVKPEPLSGSCSDFVNGSVSVRTCPPPLAQNLPRWLDPAFTAWDAASPSSPAGVTPVAPTPSYFAEYLGNGYPCGPSPGAAPNCRRYRITARAGNADRAQAMVQAIYATD